MTVTKTPLHSRRNRNDALLKTLLLSLPLSLFLVYSLYLEGALVSFVVSAWVVSVLMALIIPLMQRNLTGEQTALLTVLLVVMVILGGYAVIGRHLEEPLRIKRALSEVPTFPGAELKAVTYKSGSRIFDEPVVYVDFTLPDAPEQFCEVAAYLETELTSRGWRKELRSPGVSPRVGSEELGIECPPGERYSKDSPRRAIKFSYLWVNPRRTHPVDSNSFRIQMNFY